jgi:integrase
MLALSSPARISYLRRAGLRFAGVSPVPRFRKCIRSGIWVPAKGIPMADPAAARGGGTAGSPRRQPVTATALRGLSRFAEARGVPAGREFLLDYDVIEAFCVAGLADRAPATRGTYRSALYRLAEATHGPPGQRPAPFPGARAPAPYSPAERAELAALAAAQRDPAKRSSARAMVVFGIGAGLRPGELVALCGDDIVRHGRQVLVQVGGPAARVVPVTPGYAVRARELARGAGAGHVFRPGPAGRFYKNFVTNFARGLAADPAAPGLSMRRARSTFICGHLAAGTPVPVLLAITGIAEAGSLARYARHVPGISSSKGALRARCREEARR